MDRNWTKLSVEKLEADFQRSSDTHLIPLPLPTFPDIHLYLKDESTHPTGSLKHRLARSLFLYALVNGWIGPDTAIIEASSGSTAVSEAYFARLLNLRFLAVMAKSTSPEKIRRIQRYGGECIFVETPGEERETAARLASDLNGHFMDQFTYAERATDWRGNNNIAESIFHQMEREPYPIPSWILCGVGTGGTSATLGRYVRYRGVSTSIAIVDPENSVFAEYYRTGNPALARQGGSGVEGIGRPRIEPSFMPDVIDRAISVPNAASFAAIHFLEEILGRRCGGSTGTNFFGACGLVAEMKAQGKSGSIVTLLCDGGDLYSDSYFSKPWLEANGYDLIPYLLRYQRFYEKGLWN
jgi:cysteine synthase A